MDILFAQIQADLRSNDALRQSGALLQALQQSAAGRDISTLAKSAVEEIIASPSSAVSKKLAFDLIRTTRLTSDLWDTVCTGITNDLTFPDPDVTAAAVSILAAIPSYKLGKLISDCSKEISFCFESTSENLRFSVTETLGCVLARDDLVTLCENNVALLEKVGGWWGRIGENMLDKGDNVSKVAFESVGRLFQEFESKRMSRLAGDKLVDSENSVAIRSNWVSSMVEFVWKRRNALMARSLVLPVESFRASVYPLVYGVKSVASGSIEAIMKLSRSKKKTLVMDWEWLSEFLKGMIKPAAATAVVLLAALLSYSQKLKLEREMIYAIVRAFIQLSVIGFVLQFIFNQNNGWWIILAYLFMVSIAGYTAGQRAKHVPHGKYIAGASILVGTTITMLLLVLLEVFPFTPQYIIPVAGMMVGNAMTVTGVTMKRLRDDIRAQMNLVETALALGATPRQATLQQVKRSLVIALSPVIDNTKTVGLISLPGAMTGLIMGGASPVEAIQLQMVVMNMLIGASTMSSIMSTYFCWPNFFTKAYQLETKVFSIE